MSGNWATCFLNFLGSKKKSQEIWKTFEKIKTFVEMGQSDRSLQPQIYIRKRFVCSFFL